ncbi:MAG: type II toxin-antitoxin system HicB family antitoxin, partial [Acidobacteriota bacterium]
MPEPVNRLREFNQPPVGCLGKYPEQTRDDQAALGSQPAGRLLVQDGQISSEVFRQGDGSWVAEVPAISGCYAFMPTREEALAELAEVFEMIAEEYREKGSPLLAGIPGGVLNRFGDHDLGPCCTLL